jgi:hypothetical protein
MDRHPRFARAEDKIARLSKEPCLRDNELRSAAKRPLRVGLAAATRS